MKKYKSITLLLILICYTLNSITLCFASVSDKDLSEKLTAFYTSVIQNDGYLSGNIDLIENQNGTITAEIFFKENILGVELGFYVTPNIIKALGMTGINCETRLEGEYIYLTAKKHFNNLEDATLALSGFPFIQFLSYKNNFYFKADMTIWNDIREKDQFVDDIYKTNYFVISYKPIKYMISNAPLFKNGRYSWALKDKKIINGYAEQKKDNYTIIIITIVIIGVIIMISGIILILKNPNFKIRLL